MSKTLMKLHVHVDFQKGQNKDQIIILDVGGMD